MLSLKSFHVVFIWVSVVLSVLVAAWAVQHGRWAVAAVSLAGGTWLAVYRRRFLQKARQAHLE